MNAAEAPICKVSVQTNKVQQDVTKTSTAASAPSAVASFPIPKHEYHLVHTHLTMFVHPETKHCVSEATIALKPGLLFNASKIRQYGIQVLFFIYLYSVKPSLLQNQ